jgi:hypothetical protein
MFLAKMLCRHCKESLGILQDGTLATHQLYDYAIIKKNGMVYDGIKTVAQSAVSNEEIVKKWKRIVVV